MSNGGGVFSFKHTGNVYGKTDDGELATYSSWEGAGTGYPTAFGTLSLTQTLADAGATLGACTWAGQGFLEDGTTVGALGEGTWKQLEGQHTWKIELDIAISNGERHRLVGEIDLASLTFTGTFEVI
jgi:hypothetical protein